MYRILVIENKQCYLLGSYAQEPLELVTYLLDSAAFQSHAEAEKTAIRLANEHGVIATVVDTKQTFYPPIGG